MRGRKKERERDGIARDGDEERRGKNSTSTSSLSFLCLLTSRPSFFSLAPSLSLSLPLPPPKKTHQNRLQDQKGAARRPGGQASDLGHRRPGALPHHHGELLQERDGRLVGLRRRRPSVVRERTRVDAGRGFERRGRGREGKFENSEMELRGRKKRKKKRR